jgi:hypothetical protein
VFGRSSAVRAPSWAWTCAGGAVAPSMGSRPSGHNAR